MKRQTTIAKTRNLVWLALIIAALFVVQAISVALGGRDLQKPLEGPCILMWQAVANMPLDFYGGAVASNGTYAYVAGGYSFSTGQNLTSLYRYDPVANTWTTLASAPAPGFVMASAVYYPTTNKIYVFGGEDVVSGTNYNTTRIYDIASNTWTTGANMPDVRSFMGSGYNSGNGKIYLVSGYNTGQITSAQPDTWEYDPVANTFASKAPFPHPAGGMASGVIGGHLYVAGGRDTTVVINLTWDYNIAANTWTAKANEPGTNNNVPGSGVASNVLWVFGGGNPFIAEGNPLSTAAFVRPSKAATHKIDAPATTNSTLIYNPATDTWLAGPNMTSTRAFPGGTSINNKLVAAGGYNGTTTVATTETLDATCLPTPTPTPCPSDQYTIAAGAGAIVPGTTDTGNHIDDGDTAVALPFAFKLYGQTYNSVNVNSNGRLDFVTVNEPGGFGATCLPASPNIGPYDYTIFGLWQDMRTDAALSGCAGFPGGQCGIFTSVSGVSPNRIFNIEWRSVLYANNASRQSFEIRLYENSTTTNKQFDIVYGMIDTTDADHPYVGGVQGPTGFFTQDFCGPTPPQNAVRTYTSPGCAPTVNGAVSRKTHGGAGTFDINLPLTGTPGIECRTGGGTNDYTMIVTFANPVSVTGSPQAQVTMGTGCVGTGGVCNGGTVAISGNVVTIPLTSITDDQTINVRLNGVSDGMTMGNVTVPMTRNAGDTNANGSVTSSDIAQTKGRIGQTVDATNFRSDTNASGGINSSDVTIIKQNIP